MDKNRSGAEVRGDAHDQGADGVSRRPVAGISLATKVVSKPYRPSDDDDRECGSDRCADEDAAGPCGAPEIERVGAIIRNPLEQCATNDLMQFMWLRAPDVRESAASGRFIATPQDLLQALPLYESLANRKRGENPRREMIAAAEAFEASSEDFISDLESLEERTAFGALGSALAAIEGSVPRDELVATAEELLGASLPVFLSDPSTEQLEGRLWQSLFAVSLAPTEEARLGDAYVAVLRVMTFLRRLEAEQQARPNAGCSLSAAAFRRQTLEATPILPDAVVPPSVCLGVRALGVGDLKVVRRCLQGYALGEVARVTNVMARERLELTDRELDCVSESVQDVTQTDRGGETADQNMTRSALLSEVQDLVRADRLCSQYNNLTQQYGAQGEGSDGSSHSVTLNGSWTGQEGIKERADDEAREFAEALIQRAVVRIGEAVTASRARLTHHEHEKLINHDVDNREGNEALIGIYRWLQKRYRLYAQDAGKRLIVELWLANPAESLLGRIERRLDGATGPPPSLACEGVYGHEFVNIENYRYLASVFGLEDPEQPPAKVLQLVADFRNQAPVHSTQIRLPEGYAVSGAQVSYLLSDDRSSLVGYLGNQTFSVEGSTSTSSPAPIGGTAPTAPQGSNGDATDDEDSSCPPLADPVLAAEMSGTPTVGIQTLGAIRLDGDALPVGVFSDASLYQVTVQVEVTLEDEFLQAWQARIYEALAAAQRQARKVFDSRQAELLAAEADGQERVIERRELQRHGTHLLWQLHRASAPITSPSSVSPTLCEDAGLQLSQFFEHALEWPDMTYAFHAWSIDTPACPRDVRPRDACWRGQEVAAGCGADALFKSFLEAKTARVLVPVRPGSELAVLHFLSYGRLWQGPAAAAPVAQLDLPLVADARSPRAVERPPETTDCWEIAVPTSMVLLQRDDTLPELRCPDTHPAIALPCEERPWDGACNGGGDGAQWPGDPVVSQPLAEPSSPDKPDSLPAQVWKGNQAERVTSGITRIG